MTVYDRPQLVLMNTLVKLGCNDWSDGEIVVVDDGSNLPYDPIKSAMSGLPIRWVRVDTVRDRPETYNLDGYNNPAYAANHGLGESRGEFVFWLSSDVALQPHSVDRAFDLDLHEVAWMPTIIDMDSRMEYLGPSRLVPLGWFYGTHRDNMPGWDEEYLKGLAFEDNDVMARLALRVGRFVIDQSCTGWHQSHEQTAYSDNLEGWRINREYTIKKWGAVPWDKDCPLEKTATQVNHQIIVDVKARDDVSLPA